MQKRLVNRTNEKSFILIILLYGNLSCDFVKNDKKLEKTEGELKRVSKIPETLKSPYFARMVDVTEKIMDMEKLITTYVQKCTSSSK